MKKKTRPYTMKRRAEQQAETRLRIVEAAVELHGALGPANTPLSLIAERAGVQRHTLYAHFPDERSLLMACSGLAIARDPPPDAAPWRGIADRDSRLRTGLRAVYDWFARNERLMGCVMRDAEHSPLVREIMEVQYGPSLAALHDVLGAGLNPKQRAMLTLALSFFTWRTLAREGGLKVAAAANAMAQTIEAAG